MDSYSNKINRIKYTIDEIREDIEQMKLKNEKTINTMMSSVTPPQEKYYAESNNLNQIQITINEDDDKEDLLRKFEISEGNNYNQMMGINRNNLMSINENDVPNNSNSIIKQSEGNDNIPYDYNNNNNSGSGSHYENDEIANLQAMINDLKKQNDMLATDLQAEQKKNHILLERNNGGNKELIMIQNCLGVSCSDDIIPRIEDLLRNNEDNKLRDELIDKLTTLYTSLTGIKKNDSIDIKTIWRWIKHLINTVKDLASEKERGIEAVQSLQETNCYKEYCLQMIQEFNLNNVEDLRDFINDLLTKNNINKKRVDKIKKVLTNPTKDQQRAHSQHNYFQ